MSCRSVKCDVGLERLLPQARRLLRLQDMVDLGVDGLWVRDSGERSLATKEEAAYVCHDSTRFCAAVGPLLWPAITVLLGDAKNRR